MTSILTGDIINSRQIPSEKWLPVLKEAFYTFGNSPKFWEIYRGDSFQLEIKDLKTAFLFAVTLKASLKKIKSLDVRISIGIGNTTNNYTHITEGSGEAFINSGLAFDTLLKKQNIAFLSPSEDFNTIINSALALALLTMDSWTVNSAIFVEKFLKNTSKTQKVIAQELQISESSASERKKRAGIDEILQLEKLYREVLLTKYLK